MPEQIYSVSDFQALCNQILDHAFPTVTIEGEVASFKLNQNKFVFFDLKDATASVGCFMMAFALRFPLADGMKVRIRATPKLTNWGKFSLTIQSVMPIGEGSIRKSLELLKQKLEQEGLFNPTRKRPLPPNLTQIAVISSTQAAGYADFIKILNERWGGLNVRVAHTQVQGAVAADQIIRALRYFNEQGTAQIIAIIRGGGSADDLAVFNDEQLVRAIAASKIPVITGIGHEVDQSLADLAADLVASTPSNAAQMLTPDKSAVLTSLHTDLNRINNLLNDRLESVNNTQKQQIITISTHLLSKIQLECSNLLHTRHILDTFNPENVLARGYALIRGQIEQGAIIEIATAQYQLTAEVQHAKKR